MDKQELYDELRKEWSECKKCEIGCLARQHVLYSGPLTSKVLFVGEGPGNEEDYHGRAFVGRSGRLLRRALIEAGFDPNRFCFTNLVACRPVDDMGHNRDPSRSEIERCRPRLLSVIGLVQPVAIVTLGRMAQYFLPMKGQFIKVLWLKHPSWVLRSGGEESKAFKDYVTSLRIFLKEVNA